jgi:hypothetical protein
MIGMGVAVGSGGLVGVSVDPGKASKTDVGVGIVVGGWVGVIVGGLVAAARVWVADSAGDVAVVVGFSATGMERGEVSVERRAIAAIPRITTTDMTARTADWAFAGGWWGFFGRQAF